MHSPRPVSAENTLRGRAAAALYHNPARMCQKASIRTDRKGERTRIRANRTAKPQSHTPERRCVVKSQAELVRLLSQWCVYFRALRAAYRTTTCGMAIVHYAISARHKHIRNCSQNIQTCQLQPTRRHDLTRLLGRKGPQYPTGRSLPVPWRGGAGWRGGGTRRRR